MWLALPEMGLSGIAQVVSVRPCPPPEEGPGHVVLTTVTHFNGRVLRLWLNGLDTPLEPTSTHWLYSEDRCAWVPAEELTAGERLRTALGPVAIVRIASKPGIHRVYNLEVETEHCYYVSIAGVLCHNINGCSVGKYGYLKDPPGVSKGREFSKEQRLTVLSENMKHNNGKLRCDQTGIFLTLEPGPTQAQVDHIMPKAAGGTNSYGNAQVLSRDANQAKGDSIP